MQFLFRHIVNSRAVQLFQCQYHACNVCANLHELRDIEKNMAHKAKKFIDQQKHPRWLKNQSTKLKRTRESKKTKANAVGNINT